MNITDYAIRQKTKELMESRMSAIELDDAADALNALTFDEGRKDAFTELLRSRDACAVGHALLRAIESGMEHEAELDARIALREEAEERELADRCKDKARIFADACERHGGRV